MRSGYHILHANIHLSELRANPDPVSFSVSECGPPQAMPVSRFRFFAAIHSIFQVSYHRGMIWDRSAHFFDGNTLHLVMRLPVNGTMRFVAYAIRFGKPHHPSISPNMLGLLGTGTAWAYIHIFPNRHEGCILGFLEDETTLRPCPTQFYSFTLSGEGSISSMDLYASHPPTNLSDSVIFSDKTFEHIIVPRGPDPVLILRTLVPPCVTVRSHPMQVPQAILDALRRASVSASYSDTLFDFNTGTMAFKLSSYDTNQLIFVHYA